MLVVGFGIIVCMASCNTIMQTIVDEDKRGRVMSFYAIAFIGMAPFGSLIGGSIAHKIGAPFTIVLCGILSIAGAVLFYTRLSEIRKFVRPYLRSNGYYSGKCRQNYNKLPIPLERLMLESPMFM